MVLVAVVLVLQLDVMLLPGANTSTQLPQLLYDDWASLLSVEPTVIANGSEAGE